MRRELLDEQLDHGRVIIDDENLGWVRHPDP
jgi:hypothetical protein